MDDLTSESQYPFSEQRQKIQENIIRIRIMLWANDIQEAKKLIHSTRKDYSEILRKALKIKTNLHKQYIKGYIPDDQLKIQGITGQLLHSYKKEQRGRQLVLNSENDYDDTDADALYVLSPLASNLEILHGRLKTIKQHGAESGTNKAIHDFQVFISQVGTQQWEVRGYQVKNTEIDLYLFVDLLRRRLNMRFVQSESKGADWPLWMRCFTENFYVELRFYSNKQFLVQVILAEQNDPQFIIDELLSCYSQSIKDS